MKYGIRDRNQWWDGGGFGDRERRKIYDSLQDLPKRLIDQDCVGMLDVWGVVGSSKIIGVYYDNEIDTVIATIVKITDVSD